MLKEAFLSFEALGFNRYMVECESFRVTYSTKSKNVLIDTWWNVNDSLPVREIEHNLVLIDTWWNVNK